MSMHILMANRHIHSQNVGYTAFDLYSFHSTKSYTTPTWHHSWLLCDLYMLHLYISKSNAKDIHKLRSK